MNMCRSCPMLNSQGVCDTALRRPERIRRCPHQRMRLAIPCPPAKQGAQARLLAAYMQEAHLPDKLRRELEARLTQKGRPPDG